jgi:nitrogen-specific signal transduction histidine kinase
MPNTISAEKGTITRCAVFKIDLKGRFVYIDDETEELLGYSRDELLGKSIYEVISNGSLQHLEQVLNHHSRYESFYRALPLTLRVADDKLCRFETVVTLNFIGGNPVNYQLILIPSRSEEVSSGSSVERQFLELINQGPEAIDFNIIAEIFGRVGGYAGVGCYLSDINGRLELVGSYPRQNLDYTPPAYLEQYVHDNRGVEFDMPEFRELHVEFCERKAEAAVFLKYNGDRKLFLHLHGPADYRPSPMIHAEMSLLAKTWNRHFAAADMTASPADQLSLLGRIGNSLQTGVVAIDPGFSIIYKNDYFIQSFPAQSRNSDTDFRNMFTSLQLCRQSGDPVSFQQSPFSNIFSGEAMIAAFYKTVDGKHMVSLLAGSLQMAGSSITVFLFLPGSVLDCEIGSSLESTRKLIRNLVHDLRAPLITIDAFSGNLQKEHAGQLDDEGRFAVNCLRENGRILQEMIDGLSDMSGNWVMGQMAEKVNVSDVVNDTVKLLKATYPDTNYQVEIDENLPEVIAPKDKLIQVLRNILDNAFKYSMSSERPTVIIMYSRENGRHLFSVSDYGPGIGDDYKDKVFEPFFRIPREGLKDIPGTGMGLAIVRDLIVSWGGKIWLENSSQAGTTVSFTLPVQAGD